MSTNFPGALDSYATLVDGTDILEAADQNNVRDAIEAIQAKIGVTTSGVASSHEYRIAQRESGILVASGATVFNTTVASGGTLQDLDVSGTVGTKVARCLFEVAIAGTCGYIMAPKGYGGAFSAHTASGWIGPSNALNSANPGYHYFCMDTNSSGVLRHGASSAAITITIKLINFTL